MNLDKDTVIGGRYRVVEQIGIGGMSIVYRCKDEKLGRDVTVKILKDTYSKDEKFKHKFKTEAYSIAKLSHPNIVNVYDSGEEAGVCYIVMEYVDGMTLKEVIDEQAPLSSVTVLSIASQISSALMHAHKNHIVHRDIKPQNILVAYDGTIKVTDFGIAKGVSEDTLTAKSDSLGSVYYLSPEQARGGYVDERSDIYSLGITMYEMITGELPFDGDNSVNVAIKHMSEELPDIEEINPDADELLQQIIYKATNKKADERYANVALMNEDIVTALSDIANGTSYVPDDDYDDDDYDDYDDYDDDDYYEEEIRKPKKEKRKKASSEDDETERKVVVAAVITALIIIAIISVFGYKALFGAGKIEMPNLVGMELESAKLEAAGKNLNLVIDEQGYSDEYDKGIVYEQSKHAGSKVKENSEIKVSVSLGKNNGETPDFLYMDKNEAVTAIKGLTGKEPEVNEVYDDTIPEGLVCEQYPEAGSNFEKNTKFKITISKGSEVTTTTVPRITGMSVDKAEKALEEAHLSIGKISRTYSDSAPIDTIISQATSSGEVVERDSKVDVVISKGKLVYIPVEGETTSSSNNNSSSNSDSDVTTPVIGTDEPETNTSTNTSGTLSFTVSLPSGVSGSAAVKLVKIENGSNVSEVYNSTVEEANFPFNVNVTGTGNAEVQLYINDSYQWSQYVNFSEGGN